MRLPLYQVDAFAERVFEGNPAAVGPLERWLPDALLQAIAEENHLSETAFLVEGDAGAPIALRWFTPVAEVDLCGHATLAAAHVLFRHRGVAGDEVRFATRSGELRVRRRGGARYELDLPGAVPQPVTEPGGLADALGARPVETRSGTDLVAVLGSEADVAALAPDFRELARLPWRGVLATAPAEPRAEGPLDFVSRCFFPALGVDEDPVTGSAHAELAPLWAERLGRSALVARQLSARGGRLDCEVVGDRVRLVGGVVDYLTGEIDVPEGER